MKKLKFVFVLLMLLTTLMFAEKAATFPELTKPFLIHTDETQLYIADGPHVFIYSLQDYNLVKKFGGVGDGHGEFRVDSNRSGGSVVIFLQSDSIVANSSGKVSIFSKDGKYRECFSVKPGISRLQPLGKQFVGETFFKSTKKDIYYLSRDIYDRQIKWVEEILKQKAFYQIKGELNPFYLIGPITHVYDNKVFIIMEMSEIGVFKFEESVKKLHSIKPDDEKLPIAEYYKKKFHNGFKNYPPLKKSYDMVKDRLKFPKYFPAIRFFHVADNKVYILTYKKIGEKSEFAIYDINGEFLKKIMTPLVERNDFGFLYYPYTINNDKLYQIVENPDEKKWELHVTAIK
jgi:hypothetical protein